jgi:glycosyltransferase involved in cell wall biosynthesis
VWNGKSLAIILPTYNEKDSIAGVIHRFEALQIADDILVVNNNAALGTSDEVAKTGAREVHEARQGYGAAIQRGLREVDTDLVCVCEPDGTFDPEDIQKLLVFSSECDFVVGSRTVSNFIWDGANMGWFLQWGNWAVAKLIEVLYNTSYLSDVGCTFRLLSRERAAAILARSRLDGSAYGLEMLLHAVSMRTRLVQVPVNYHPRVGISAVTGDLGKTIRLGLEMIGLVLRMRVRLARDDRPVTSSAPPSSLTHHAAIASPPSADSERKDPRRIPIRSLARRR